MAREWSVFQNNIFTFVADRKAGNGIVEAVAGSGKTTTIVEAMKLAHGTSIFLAFNKSIAEELKARGVNARTFHSLTFSAVMNSRGQRNPEMDKLRKICKEMLSGEEERLYGAFACRLVGLARQLGIGCLERDTEEAWIRICEHYDIEPESEYAEFGRGIEIARDLLASSNKSEMVDFDDMLYFAVKDGINLPKFDFVFVDESQDTNAIQRAILRKIMKPTSRLIAVGDPAQAIYGFRGADSDSLNMIAQEFNCTRLPLSITYRCPKSVVSYAQQWVDHIQAADGAEEGEVHELSSDWSMDLFEAQDLVVCRKTAPLIKLAYRFIRARKPVTVMGREIGAGLKALIKKMNAKGVDHLETKLRTYLDREVEKAKAKGDDSKVEAIEDKVGSLIFMIEALPETDRTIPALERFIDDLFQDKRNATVFATIHKAKGLEADRVFWLDRSECPSKWARQDWQKQQEDNLCYVAATRAKKALYLIEMKGSE